MTESDQPAAMTSERSSGFPTVLAIVTEIAVLQITLLLVFSWPASRAEPHDVPIVVAGPTQATQTLTKGLAENAPGAFDIRTVSTGTQAQDAVKNREASAAVVTDPTGVTIYTASADSASLAQALGTEISSAIETTAPNVSVTVVDLVPAPNHDPHGAAIPAGLIPLTITSIAAGIVVGLLSSRRATRTLALLLFAVLAGGLTTLALHTVLGALDGYWSVEAGVLALASLAISAVAAGLTGLLRIAGAVLAAVVIFFFGYPFSGATTGWWLIPAPWGQIAQDLPIGATNQALRSVSSFSGAGATTSLLVLAAWTIVGLIAVQVVRRPTTGVTEP